MAADRKHLRAVDSSDTGAAALAALRAGPKPTKPKAKKKRELEPMTDGEGLSDGGRPDGDPGRVIIAPAPCERPRITAREAEAMARAYTILRRKRSNGIALEQLAELLERTRRPGQPELSTDDVRHTVELLQRTEQARLGVGGGYLACLPPSAGRGLVGHD